jgi:hypothetical protein
MEKVAIWVAIAIAIVLSVVAITSKSEVVGGVTWDKEIFQDDVDIKGALDVDGATAVGGALTLTGALTGSAGLAGTKLCIDNSSSSYTIIDFVGETTTPTYSTSTTCN